MVITTPLFNIKALSLAWSYNSDCPTVQKERVHNRVDTTVYLETFQYIYCIYIYMYAYIYIYILFHYISLSGIFNETNAQACHREHPI